jgi:hypothetical protein
MLELHEEANGKIVVATLSGKLTTDDYKWFVPEVERLLRTHAKIRVLCRMQDFHGWEFGALWEDIRFELKHFADIERLALVGHHKWHAGIATFCRPFTKAKVRYFDERDSRLAEEWIRAGLLIAAVEDGEHATFPTTHATVHEASEKPVSASDAAEYWSSAI